MVDVASAIDRTRAGDAAWAAAMSNHELAPPDAGFASRLRETAEAASAQARGIEYAITAGLTRKEAWPVAPTFPYELSPDANRPGDAKLWQRWDDAVVDWQNSALGTSLAELARTFRILAAYAEALADSVDQERGVTAPDARQSDAV